VLLRFRCFACHSYGLSSVGFDRHPLQVEPEMATAPEVATWRTRGLFRASISITRSGDRRGIEGRWFSPRRDLWFRVWRVRTI
jgi:hypothetical protein